MRDVIQFLTQNIFLCFLVIIVWNILGFGFLALRRQRRGLVFPKVTDEDIVFYESMASGSSHKSLLTRLGGASRCLKVFVTQTSLAITTSFPFNLFNGIYDLDHIVSLSDLEQIECNGGTINLDFRNTSGSTTRLTLRLKDSEGFLKAIRIS